jgi:hypothetical protein
MDWISNPRHGMLKSDVFAFFFLFPILNRISVRSFPIANIAPPFYTRFPWRY